MKGPLILLALGLSLMLAVTSAMPDPVDPPEPHKNHAIFFVKCGNILGVLLTSDPPLWADEKRPASNYMKRLLREAEDAERVGMVALPCPPRERV